MVLSGLLVPLFPLILLIAHFQQSVTDRDGQGSYRPDWGSLDSRPVPLWFDEAKLGIFSHWGVYSVPAYGSEWFWWGWKGDHNPSFEKFVEKHYPNGTTYADFAKMFTAEDLNTAEFANIIKSSGARYFVLTSKHHEGYTMWPSATSWNWNAVDVGPHRDLVGDLAAAIRAAGIHFGLYFSLFDWFHPLYLSDKKQRKNNYVETVSYPQLLEIVNQYHPEVIWSDGDWEQPDTYWRSKEFLAWLYNESPVKDQIAVNDRWGSGSAGKHGGFMTYQDHYDPGKLQPRKWENCLTMDKSSWGYRRDMKPSDIRTVKDLINQLARTISCGGNMLLNIGPDHTGRIVPIFQDRLQQFGHWLAINQEAVYGTKAWIHQTDGANIWYTSRLRNSTGLDPHRMFNPQDMMNTLVFAYLLDIPRSGKINFPSILITDKTRTTVLGTTTKVPHKKNSETLWVDLSNIHWQDLPSTDAIVLKVEYAASVPHANPLKSAGRDQTSSSSSSSSSESMEMADDEEKSNSVSARKSTGMMDLMAAERVD